MKTRTTARGQVDIPVTLQRNYGIKEGTRIVIDDTGTSIVFRPITEDHLIRLRGSLGGKGVLKVVVDKRHED